MYSVREDIVKNLGIQSSFNLFLSSFNRINLDYQVRFKPKDTNDPFDNLCEFIKEFPRGTAGVMYEFFFSPPSLIIYICIEY
jgi:superfamily II DNA helicase RecQ